jgi:hypothetical protein
MSVDDTVLTPPGTLASGISQPATGDIWIIEPNVAEAGCAGAVIGAAVAAAVVLGAAFFWAVGGAFFSF